MEQNKKYSTHVVKTEVCYLLEGMVFLLPLSALAFGGAIWLVIAPFTVDLTPWAAIGAIPLAGVGWLIGDQAMNVFSEVFRGTQRLRGKINNREKIDGGHDEPDEYKFQVGDVTFENRYAFDQVRDGDEVTVQYWDNDVLHSITVHPPSISQSGSSEADEQTEQRKLP